ncbi:MAG: hypothetical protein NZ455_11990 [Bacteroidia bacterium]|nr:hypothetical protein [Bacteroidia bacterium]MDW8347182.1 hypothetical protein [Bacteroidia bacterium]
MLTAGQVTFSSPSGYVLLCALIAAGFSLLLYRFKKETEFSTQIRWILTLLRFLSVFLILLLLLEPSWYKTYSKIQKPTILLIQDNSQSLLAQKDSAYLKGLYISEMKKVLQNPSLQEKAYFETHLFDKTLHLNKPIDSLNFKGTQTHLSDAAQEIYNLYQDHYLAGVILATDGIYTQGHNPTTLFTKLNVPFFNLVLGDTTRKKDIRIKNVQHNRTAYINTEIPIQIEYESISYPDQKTELNILHQGKIIYTQALSFSTVIEQNSVMALLKPEQEGVQTYDIVIKGLEGEASYKNNQWRIYIKVEKNKQKILLLSGSPSPDVMAIHRAIANTGNTDLQIISRIRSTEFTENINTIVFADYDALIIHNFPNQNTDISIINTINQAVDKVKVPIFYLVGTNTNLDLLNNFNNIGIRKIRSRPTFSECHFEVAEEYLTHSTFTFDAHQFKDLFKNAPPLQCADAEIAAKPNSKVLGKKVIQNLILDVPLFVLQDEMNYRNAVLIGDNYWKVRMTNYIQNKNFAIFDTWIQNILQWLMANKDKRKLIVNTNQRLYENTDAVIFKGEMYDESYNGVENGEIKVNLVNQKKEMQTYFLKPQGKGIYQLNIGSLPEGEYSFTAEGRDKNKKLGTDGGKFTVTKVQAEFQNVVANFDLLNQIALRTEGKVYLQNEINRLKEDLLKDNRIKPRSIKIEENRPFRVFWWYMVGIILLLATEWVIRKYYGRT